MPRVFAAPAFRVALLAVTLALLFLGSRGIWDPDEGRYTNVALNMLDSGDWLNPRRNHEVGHWTKPPLTYWAIAGSVRLFGQNPWAARLPSAVAFLVCVWLAWRLGRRLVPGAQATAALAYATMLLPFGASQLITTDFVLAACQGLALWAFVEARFGAGRHPARWLVLMWVGFALGFLTKGPPALLPLLVLLLFDQLMPGRRPHRVLQLSGMLLFALLALPWYVAVIHGNPGLFAYLVGNEVVSRVATDEFGRHGQWYGWITIYAPTLLVGTLPWTPALLRWARALPDALRRWRHADGRSSDGAALLLALWVLLPLLVFCLARSRMPLYILPLFLPLAVLVARQRQHDAAGSPRWPWLLAWAGMLLVLKLASAAWPTHKDAAEWATVIRTSAPGGVVREVVFVEDMARYGLHLHLGAEIEKVSLAAPTLGFNAASDEDLMTELSEREPNVVWVCKQTLWPELQGRIAALGYQADAVGAPYRQRILFVVRPQAD